MNIRTKVILLSLGGIILLSGPARAQSEILPWRGSDDQSLEALLKRGNYLVFRSDTVLQGAGEPLKRDLVFVGCRGALDLELEGSVIALESELSLRSRARVSADVFLVRSQMFQSRRSEIAGSVVRTSEATSYKIVNDNLKDSRASRVPFRLELKTNRMGGFALEGYDRVDGFSVSWGFRLVDPDYRKSPLFEGKVITATTRQAIGFDSRFEYPLDNNRRYLVGVEARSRTDTHDRWRLGDLDNAVKAFLSGYDYRYYYRREGYGLFLRRNFGKRSHLRLTYQNESCYSLLSLSPFTLLQENFSPNHPVSSGKISSLILGGVFDGRNDRYITLSGFWVGAEAEIAGRGLGGEHDFSRFDLELKRWDTFLGRHHTFIWSKFTGSDRNLPFQRSYTLGNTLRAYGNFDFSGDRILMAQFSYSVDMPNLPLLDYVFFTWCPEIVYESGVAFNKGDPVTNYDDLKSDVGVGICGRTLIGKVGVHYFKNLDGAAIDPQVRVSLEMNVFN